MAQPGISGLLKQTILEKEAAHTLEGQLLQEHLRETYESLKPINLIKSTVKEFIASPDLHQDLINTAMGFAGGFLVKKIVMGKTNTMFSKFTGMVLEKVVASKVTNNAEEIKIIAGIVLQKFIQRHTPAETTA